MKLSIKSQCEIKNFNINKNWELLHWNYAIRNAKRLIEQGSSSSNPSLHKLHTYTQAVMSKGPAISIELGTTYSCVFPTQKSGNNCQWSGKLNYLKLCCLYWYRMVNQWCYKESSCNESYLHHFFIANTWLDIDLMMLFSNLIWSIGPSWWSVMPAGSRSK